MHSFYNIVKSYNLNNLSYDKLEKIILSFDALMNNLEITDNGEFWNIMKDIHESICGCHFNEIYAKYQVSKMYHTDKHGIKHYGEKFTEDDAKQIYDMYVRRMGRSHNHWDVYVALNAQYHDNVCIIRDWFIEKEKEEIKEKIIASGVNFWFEDEDAKEGKVWNYFKNVA